MAVMDGSPGDPNQVSEVLVAIHGVNTTTGVSEAWNSMVGMVQVQPNLQPSGILQIPAVGEQWMVERSGAQYFLKSKTDYNDPNVLLGYDEGMTAIGNTLGPTYVSGSKVSLRGSETHLDSDTTFLGAYAIRVNPSTGLLQVRDASGTWNNVDTAPAPAAAAVSLKCIRYRLASGTANRTLNSGQNNQVVLLAQSGDSASGVCSMDSTGKLTFQRAGRYNIQLRLGTTSTGVVSGSVLAPNIARNSVSVAWVAYQQTGYIQGECLALGVDLAVGDYIGPGGYYQAGSGGASSVTLQDNNGNGTYNNELVITYIA